MSKKDKTTIFDFETISRPIEAEARYQKMEASWWENGILLVCIAFAMGALDAAYLFDMTELVLNQNEYIGKIGAFGIALILNFLPLVIAKEVNKASYGLEHNAKAYAIGSAVAFAVLYIGVVLLRFQCLELYTSTVGNELENKAAATPIVVDAAVSEVSYRRAVFTAVLLSLEPLATSAFSFFLALLTDNALKKQIAWLTTRMLELKEAHNRISTAIASLCEDKDFMMECDREQYEAARDLVAAEAGRLKTEARMMLAARLKDPEAMTKLAHDDTETDLSETDKVDTEKEMGSDSSKESPNKTAA